MEVNLRNTGSYLSGVSRGGFYLVRWCVKCILPPGAAKYSFVSGCVKSLLPPPAAKHSFVRHVIFTISRSEIVKMTCLTKYNLARSAVKRLFTQPQIAKRLIK